MMGVDLSGAPLTRQQAVQMMMVMRQAKQRHRAVSLLNGIKRVKLRAQET
jgi:hypothetical protein